MEKIRIRPLRPALMTQPDWQMERQDPDLTSWVRRRRSNVYGSLRVVHGIRFIRALLGQRPGQPYRVPSAG